MYATKARAIPEFESAGNNTQGLDYARQQPRRLDHHPCRGQIGHARSPLPGRVDEGRRGCGYPADNPELQASRPSAKASGFFASLRSKF